jgi:uncharacterized protein YyaL (SSP411 family)
MSHVNAPTRTNRLARETSPYLLQHASNPVDWYPWGEEALARARAEDKPILLSIGYSACHWCHVMAHESFEDEQVAAVMNELFVNVKVDREERPDLDKIYQLAQQLITQRPGGWPLTMFLSPHDLRPFFGGTYFPKEARFGLPAFPDLLRRVSEYYRSRRDAIDRQSAALDEALHNILTVSPAATPLSPQPIEAARQRLAAAFDPDYGGFGQAPKFPHPTNLDLLLRLWRATAADDTPDLHSLYMVTLTLTRMAEGGLYDQIGGGFARYSVDERWMIPHFEKMLYDNGQLLKLYAQATLATGEPLFRSVASQTAEWIRREMQAPDAGYWSSLDADSEGEEGRFYLWDKDDLAARLDPPTFDLVARRFGLDQPPNFEGRWHLCVHRSYEDIARETGLDAHTVEQRLASARAALLAAREQRVRPARDEKVLTSWNALAVSGMLVAARALDDAELERSALRALDFLQTTLFRDGRLLAAYKDGQARFAAYLDDHAFLLDALIEALQTRWRTSDLRLAIRLAETLLERFEDQTDGGFFFTADDHERLIVRPKSFADEALPSGNGIAAQALMRLGLLLGETRYLDAAARTLQAGWAAIETYPHGHASMLVALDDYLDAPEIVILRGEQPELAEWHTQLNRLYAPKRLVFAIPNDAADLPASLADKRPEQGTVGYICRGTSCSAPVRSLAALAKLSVPG